jgi:SSS family solute:Na+ symporter
LCGLVTVCYMAIGGMRSVVYTNLANCIIKYVGVIVALTFALSESGGIGHLQASLSADMFSWHAVGFGKIFSWFIGGVGSIFATQYVLQAIVITDDTKKARHATVMIFTLMIPFGILIALIGMCSAFLYPNIRSIDAFPEVISHLPTWSASLAVVGIAGAMLGGISANTIASATLILRDFYDPHFNPKRSDRNSVVFLRISTVVIGLVPLILSLYATQILDIAFLGKALRASLAVLILLAFYAPRFGTPTGAFWGIVLSVVMTVGWYLAHEPFGISSTYFAFFCPLLVMAISHVFSSKRSAEISARSGS